MGEAGASASDWLKHFGCTATSCVVADTLCLPADLLKTRMQLQNELRSSKFRVGVAEMTVQVYKAEGGAPAFFRGLPAAVLRQTVYGGLSFALYPYIRDGLGNAASQRPGADASASAGATPAPVSATTPLWCKVVAGAAAGGIGSALANPADVVKVRLQADGRVILAGKTPRYTGVWSAATGIMRAEGITAFYQGFASSVGRAMMTNAVGMSTYDQTKAMTTDLLGESDTMAARFVAASLTGVSSALVSCPFDVVKTRMMNQWHKDPAPRTRGGCHGAAPRHAPASAALLHVHTKPLYTGTLHCLVSVVSAEGAAALWKGFVPVYLRQAPFVMFQYLIMEQLTLFFLGTSL